MKHTHYPAKTCDIDRLVTHPKLVEAVLTGKKTQQRRDGIYAYPDETFELNGTRFIVKSLTRETLADMDVQRAQAEGYPDLESYKELILRMHPGMEWDLTHKVWVHTFEKA